MPPKYQKLDGKKLEGPRVTIKLPRQDSFPGVLREFSEDGSGVKVATVWAGRPGHEQWRTIRAEYVTVHRERKRKGDPDA